MSNDTQNDQLIMEICKFLPGKSQEWLEKNIKKAAKTEKGTSELIQLLYEFYIAIAVSNKRILLYNKQNSKKMQLNTVSSATLLAMIRYPNVIKNLTENLLRQEKVVSSKNSVVKGMQIKKLLFSLLHRKPGIYFVGDLKALKMLKENKKLLKAIKSECQQGKSFDFTGYGGIIVNTKIPDEEVVEMLPRAIYMLQKELCDTQDVLIMKAI